MPAFATRSGLPNSTINLASGASAAMPWANGGAVLSELGSVQLELARRPSIISGLGFWIGFHSNGAPHVTRSWAAFKRSWRALHLSNP